MKFLRSTDPRFHLVDVKVRIFLLVALAGSVLVAAFVAWRQDIFTPSVNYILQPESSLNLQPGMTVKLRGFRVGKVARVVLEENGEVRVRLTVNRHYAKHVHADTVARLSSEGMIGDFFIDLSGGTPGIAAAVENCTFRLEREISLNEMADKLRVEMQPTLEELRKLVTWMDDPRSEVRMTLANLQTASASIAANLPDTMTAAHETALHSHQFFDYAIDPNGDFKLALHNLEETTRQLNTRLPVIVDQTASSVARLEKTIAVLQKAIEESAPKLPRMVERGAHAAEGASEVVDALSGMWPIRSGVKKQREQPLTVRGVR